jgi:uncharacterized pyridoxal phosphate-containing UPF0001 family protein
LINLNGTIDLPDMNYPGLASRVSEVRTRIAERQAARGWTHEVSIIAVTKTHPAEAVRAALDAGLTAVGENRQEAPAGGAWRSRSSGT